MKREIHGQGLIGVHAQKIDVHDVAARRMALQVLHHRGDLLAAEVELQHLGVEGFNAFSLGQFPSFEGHGLGCGFPPIDNTGHTLFQTTQAAARTLPHIFPWLGVQNQLVGHDNTSLTGERYRPGATTESTPLARPELGLGHHAAQYAPSRRVR